MKNVFYSLILLVAILSCNSSNTKPEAQPVTPEKTLEKILTIAQSKNKLTIDEYHEIENLINQNSEAFERYLEQQGVAYEIKVELLDAIYKEIFDTYQDTTALQQREKLCLWIRNNYPSGSVERKVGDSRLVETYTCWKKFDKALEQVDLNIQDCTYPSLDHVNCTYTKGWVLSEMNRIDEANSILNETVYELRVLLRMVDNARAKKDIPEEELDFLEQGRNEIINAAKDIQTLVDEMKKK